MKNLAGKVVIVTGSAKGIGLGISRRMLSEGCFVILVDINKEGLDKAQADLDRLGENSATFCTDFTNQMGIHCISEWVAERFGKIDTIVNNAVTGYRKRTWFAELDLQDFEDTVQQNCRGLFIMCKEFFPLLRKSENGSIINISSIGATRSFRGNLPYITSKGAVEGFTRSLAMDLSPFRIRVNTIAPGMIETDDAWQNVNSVEYQRRSAIIPLNRPGKVDDIAALVAFLASDDASYINSELIHVDGGLANQCYSADFEVPYFIKEPPLD